MNPEVQPDPIVNEHPQARARVHVCRPYNTRGLCILRGQF